MPRVACPKCSASCEVEDDLAADARVRCDRCGKRFSPGTAPADDAPLELDECEEDPTGRRSRLVLLVACGGLVLLLVSVAVGWLVSRPSKRDEPPVAVAPPTDPQPPPVKQPDPPAPAGPRVTPGDGERLSAFALVHRYRTDPERGAVRYGGANLTVSGEVADAAERRVDGEVVVGLAGPDDLRVWCRLGPAADPARLPVGADVTVRGRCLGSGLTVGAANGFRVAGDVILADCVLVGEPFLPKPASPPTPPASPTLPTPDGVDHPKGITEEGVEMRVTAVQVGHPVLVLGSGGPNAGATAHP